MITHVPLYVYNTQYPRSRTAIPTLSQHCRNLTACIGLYTYGLISRNNGNRRGGAESLDVMRVAASKSGVRSPGHSDMLVRS